MMAAIRAQANINSISATPMSPIWLPLRRNAPSASASLVLSPSSARRLTVQTTVKIGPTIRNPAASGSTR